MAPILQGCCFAPRNLPVAAVAPRPAAATRDSLVATTFYSFARRHVVSVGQLQLLTKRAHVIAAAGVVLVVCAASS